MRKFAFENAQCEQTSNALKEIFYNKFKFNRMTM